MDLKHFYFLSPQYFADFPIPTMMSNHPSSNNGSHNRPCFYAFTNDDVIYWLIPISSKVNKFKTIYQNKVQKYGKCDTIEFGYVLGYEKSFLIQNMCPVTQKYILNEYLDGGNNSVSLDNIASRRIITKAKKVLTLQRQGYNLIYGDVLAIEAKLLANP